LTKVTDILYKIYKGFCDISYTDRCVNSYAFILDKNVAAKNKINLYVRHNLSKNKLLLCSVIFDPKGL